MSRRLAHLVLTLALLLAGLVAGPCAGSICALAQADEMECCRSKAGIQGPSCCPDGKQLTRRATPAAVERQAAGMFGSPAVHTAPLPVLAVDARQGRTPRDVVPISAPPGTLIAHHTSLLL